MATLADVLTALQNGVVAINNVSRDIANLQLGRLPVSTVAQLPAVASSQGLLRMVTDANATTRLATVAGGGSNKIVVFCDGSNWIIL